MDGGGEGTASLRLSTTVRDCCTLTWYRGDVGSYPPRAAWDYQLAAGSSRCSGMRKQLFIVHRLPLGSSQNHRQ